MKSLPKKLLAITSLGIALLVAVVLCITLLIDINSYKPRIEIMLREVTGLNVKLNGKIGISLFPLGVSASDIHVNRKDCDILSLKKLKLGVALWPLLKKQINVTSCRLDSPTLTIVKDTTGKYNFETPGEKSAKGGISAAVGLNKISVSHGTLVYLDRRTGEETTSTNVNLTLKNLQVAQSASNLMKNITFSGSVDCGELQRKNVKIENLQSGIEAADGLIHIKPLSMDIFGTKGKGELTADMSKSDPVYNINLKIPNLDFAKLLESLGKEKLMGGKGDLVASLTMQSKGSENPMRNTKGTFSLQGENLIIYKMDLDKILESSKSSREANLADVGAFFIAGPLSTAALEALRYAGAYHEARTGETEVTKFIAKWKIKDGIADAADCALTTRRNRIAAKGKLDLVSEQYENLTVALIDHQGCAKLKQTINGPFASPRISTVSALQMLGVSLLNLYSEARGLVQGSNCEVFYSGSVGPP